MVVRKVHWTQYFVRKSLFNQFFKLWMVVKLWFHEQDHINLSSWVWQCNKGDDLCIYGFDFFFFLNYFLITLSPDSLLRLHLLSGWVQNCLTLTPPVEASSLEPMAALLHYLDSTCSDFISWADGCRIAWPWPHLCSFLDPHSPLKMCTITSTTGTQKQKVCFRLVSHVFLALWFVVGCHMATELHVSFSRVIHSASDDLSSPQQLKLYHVICFI